MPVNKLAEATNRSELQNEILERAQATSPKVLKIVEDVFLKNMEMMGAKFEVSWLANIKNDFGILAKNPNDPIGKGVYEEFSPDEIRKLYFVLYGEHLVPEPEDVNATKPTQAVSVTNEEQLEFSRSPEQTPKDPREIAEIMVRRQNLNPLKGPHSISAIERYVQAAREAGTDVSDLEAQLSDLNKKVTRARAEAMIKRRREEPANRAPSVVDVERYFQAAREAGADVSDLEAQLHI